MLGHKLSQVVSPVEETYVTFRDKSLPLQHPFFFKNAKVISDVDTQDWCSVERAFDAVKPTVIINAVGVVKQLASAHDSVVSIGVNSLLPHRLAELCHKTSSRLITISTDCVFSGRKGNYLESDFPDADDLYGRTKLLGEVNAENCLTIRTSIIGPQIYGNHSLLEWFLAQGDNPVKGYKKAIFSGWPTLELAKIILNVMQNHRDLSGMYQVAAAPINKFDLLTKIKEVYGLETAIYADDAVVCDRSLNGGKFESMTGMRAKSWDVLIEEMFQDHQNYASRQFCGASISGKV